MEAASGGVVGAPLDAQQLLKIAETLQTTNALSLIEIVEGLDLDSACDDRFLARVSEQLLVNMPVMSVSKGGFIVIVNMHEFLFSGQRDSFADLSCCSTHLWILKLTTKKIPREKSRRWCIMCTWSQAASLYPSSSQKSSPSSQTMFSNMGSPPSLVAVLKLATQWASRSKICKFISRKIYRSWKGVGFLELQSISWWWHQGKEYEMLPDTLTWSKHVCPERQQPASFEWRQPFHFRTVQLHAGVWPALFRCLCNTLLRWHEQSSCWHLGRV